VTTGNITVELTERTELRIIVDPFRGGGLVSSDRAYDFLHGMERDRGSNQFSLTLSHSKLLLTETGVDEVPREIEMDVFFDFGAGVALPERTEAKTGVVESSQEMDPRKRKRTERRRVQTSILF
jgi:hypothetical protein